MSRARRLGVILLLTVVVVSGLWVAPTGATDHRGPAPGVEQLGDAGIEPDGVLMRADLRADGAARWTIEYRVRLNDENTTAAFESLREDIEADESAYTSAFADRMRETARAAENSTGREMAVSNVSVRATRRALPQEYGVVTYRFEWAGFARSDSDTLEAGDALAGLFLDRQTTFVVAWPDAYATTSVQPAPDERRDDAVVWVGPTDFGDGEPTVSLSTAASEPTSSAGSDDGTRSDETGDGTGDAGGDDGSVLPLVGGAALLVVGAIAVAWWRRSQTDDDAVGVAPDDSPSETAGATGAGTDTENGREDGDERGDDTDGGTHDDERTDDEAAEEGATEDETTEDEPAPWEDELLSNEERVLALLEHNDGRMKQQAVAGELDWSDAKTSQVVGKLRDAEEVETFRLGRENVVSLPGSGLS